MKEPQLMLRLDGEIWQIEPGADSDENTVSVRLAKLPNDAKAIAFGVQWVQTGYGGQLWHETNLVRK